MVLWRLLVVKERAVVGIRSREFPKRVMGKPATRWGRRQWMGPSGAHNSMLGNGRSVSIPSMGSCRRNRSIEFCVLSALQSDAGYWGIYQVCPRTQSSPSSSVKKLSRGRNSSKLTGKSPVRFCDIMGSSMTKAWSFMRGRFGVFVSGVTGGSV